MSGVNRFEDLDAWKLACELRDLVYKMTRTGGSAKDFKFRDQIRDSAASAPRNISEGFGRYYPNDNANYVRWAKASLDETQNHLLHGDKEQYFTRQDFDKAWKLSKRALGATTRYLQYLERCGRNIPGQPPRDGKRRNDPPKEDGNNPESPNPEPQNPEPPNPDPKNPEPKNQENQEPEPGTGNLEPGTG